MTPMKSQLLKISLQNKRVLSEKQTYFTAHVRLTTSRSRFQAQMLPRVLRLRLLEAESIKRDRYFPRGISCHKSHQTFTEDGGKS